MRLSALCLLAMAGCEGVLAPDLSEDLAALQSDHAVLIDRVDALEQRLAELDGEDEPEVEPEPEPAPVAARPRPAPAPAPEPEPEPEKPAFPDYPHGTLQIATARKGLAIEIDHEPTEFVTPALIHLPPGTYNLKIEGFPDREVVIELNDTTMVVPR